MSPVTHKHENWDPKSYQTYIQDLGISRDLFACIFSLFLPFKVIFEQKTFTVSKDTYKLS